MARLDKIHDIVKAALVKDGWTITHDPFTVQFEEFDLYVDLAAEKVFAAERAGEKIAVEIKSFLSPSKLQDFKLALGQYEIYNIYGGFRARPKTFSGSRRGYFQNLFPKESRAVYNKSKTSAIDRG